MEILIGFVIDFILGDPYNLPHPIRWIGNLIAGLDRLLYREDDSEQLFTEQGFRFHKQGASPGADSGYRRADASVRGGNQPGGGHALPPGARIWCDTGCVRHRFQHCHHASFPGRRDGDADEARRGQRQH